MNALKDDHAKNVATFSGNYLVWKLNAKGFRRTVGGTRLPHHHHATMEAAMAEAYRLNSEYPESTFCVLQIVGRVKAASSLDTTRDGSGRYTKSAQEGAEA